MMTIIPEELRIAITRKCDGSCLHCYNESGQNTDCLQSSDYLKLIDQIKQANDAFDRITLTGGEPLLEVEKVTYIADAAKARGICVRLVTRGWELTPELCNTLKKAGITRIQIGLDSSGNTSYFDEFGKQWDTFHSWLRGDEQGFAKAVNGIRLALDAGLDVSVRYSLAKANLDDVVKTYEFLNSLGVFKFKFRLLFPDGRAQKLLLSQLVNGRDFGQAQYELIQASKGQKAIIEVMQPCLFPLQGRKTVESDKKSIQAYKEKCPCGTRAAYVDSNGDIKYCLFDESSIGNMKEKGFIDIWNSLAAKVARNKRCSLDSSGVSCSSFKLIYEQFRDYTLFMKEYAMYVKQVS